jgi:hypothetical protein
MIKSSPTEHRMAKQAAPWSTSELATLRLVWRGSARTAHLEACGPGGGCPRLGYLSSDLVS